MPVIRRVARALGTLLVVGGVLAVAWGLTVWRWQDPVTAVYTQWEQHRLSEALDRSVAAYGAQHRLVARGPSLAVAARRYRMDTRAGEAIGRIRVPRLGLDMVLVDGTDESSLEKGPGRDLRTFMPGEGRLVYVAGHRTTYLAPFSHIDRLRAGDTATLQMPYGSFRYQVTGHQIVPATALAVLREQPAREQLILQACHPRFFATERYLVRATLVSERPRPA